MKPIPDSSSRLARKRTRLATYSVSPNRFSLPSIGHRFLTWTIAVGAILCFATISRAVSVTNLWGSGTNVFYWDGETNKLMTLPGTNGPGNSGYAQIAGDPTNSIVWYTATAGVDFSPNPGPNAANSESESGPSVEIKANAMAGAFQICGTTLNGNGWRDHPRTLGIRVSDVDFGEVFSWQNEWVDGTEYVVSRLMDTNANSTGQIFDFYGWSSDLWGRKTSTNQWLGTYLYGMTGEVCSNYFYGVLDGPDGDTNNVWHFDFLTRSADTVYRVFSGNVTESQTNTVIINVTGVDLASYVPVTSYMLLSAGEWGLDESSFPSVDWSRISIQINGTTVAVDSSGNATVDLPNDTKTEFKVLVSPDSNGVVWAHLTVNVNSPPPCP